MRPIAVFARTVFPALGFRDRAARGVGAQSGGRDGHRSPLAPTAGRLA